MSNALIDKLLSRPVGWLADSISNEDIAISSRIRLARNLAGHCFPVHASDGELGEIVWLVTDAVRKIFGEERMEFNISELDSTERMILFERRLVSQELFKRPVGARLLLELNECAGVMVNEEDHLRLQALMPGLQLEKVYEYIDKIDGMLAEKLDFAFDRKLGFLTSCPSNLGTGMRASVMLHLPALVMSGQIGGAIQGISKLGLTVRGIFGEGSDNRGNLFQVSNQSTLGENEAEILERLKLVIAKLIEHEKRARGGLLEGSANVLFDRIGRAYGVLRHSYVLSAEEALNSLSMIRLGVDMKMFSNVDIHMVNELFINVNPAHLRRYSMLSEGEIAGLDAARATMVRNLLKSN